MTKGVKALDSSKPTQRGGLTATGVAQIAAIVGFIGAALLLNVFLRPGTSQATPVAQNHSAGPRVTVLEPAIETFTPIVTVNGAVEVQAQTPIATEVAGRIQSVSNAFRAGAAVTAGDVLFQLESVDFELQRSAALGELGSAQAALAQEQVEAQAAMEDWNQVFPNKAMPALAQRAPQLEAAKARVKSAQAAVDTAALAIKRTVITAPESGRLLTASAAPGQMLSPGDVVGQFYAYSRVEFSFALPLETVRRIEPLSGHTLTFPTRPGLVALVDRKDGALDERTRQVIIKARFSGAADVLPGEFLTAQFEEQPLKNVIKLPAHVLIDSSSVFIADADQAYARSVSVERRAGQYVYVRAFDYGDGIITNPPPGLRSGNPIERIGDTGPLLASAAANP